jgi:hypothetical protein
MWERDKNNDKEDGGSFWKGIWKIIIKIKNNDKINVRSGINVGG